MVKGVMVSPIDVLATCLPDPASLGDRMSGKTCDRYLGDGNKKMVNIGKLYFTR